MRQLFKKHNEWIWSEKHTKVFNKTLAKHRDIFRNTLFAKKVWRRRGSNPRHTGWEISCYNAQNENIIITDAGTKGLGATLWQKQKV